MAVLSACVLAGRPFTTARPRPVARSCSRTTVVCQAAKGGERNAPVAKLLKSVGSTEIRSKALWEAMSAGEFKSKTYMKDIINIAQRKNLLEVRFDGAAFVYYVTDKGKRVIEKSS